MSSEVHAGGVQAHSSAKRCLAKDPDDRWQAASDPEQELKWLARKRFACGNRCAEESPLTLGPDDRHDGFFVLTTLALGVAAIDQYRSLNNPAVARFFVFSRGDD